MKFYILIVLITACNFKNEAVIVQKNEAQKNKIANNVSLIEEQGRTIEKRFITPLGYERNRENENSYPFFLRNLKLKPNGTAVFLYNGNLKKNQSAHIAVLDVSVGDKDLQQCADAVMRLRADYLYSQKRYDEISFNFNNGFEANYSQWRNGYSIQVNNNKCIWIKSNTEHTSIESYQNYLQTVFSYAGSLSLSHQLRAVKNMNEIQAGDVWIHGGSPGHAVIVIDVAKNKNGNKIFMIAQSYMPAQDIQVLKNPLNTDENPWYKIEEVTDKLYTPEYTFDKSELMRF